MLTRCISHARFVGNPPSIRGNPDINRAEFWHTVAFGKRGNANLPKEEHTHLSMLAVYTNWYEINLSHQCLNTAQHYRERSTLITATNIGRTIAIVVNPAEMRCRRNIRQMRIAPITLGCHHHALVALLELRWKAIYVAMSQSESRDCALFQWKRQHRVWRYHRYRSNSVGVVNGLLQVNDANVIIQGHWIVIGMDFSFTAFEKFQLIAIRAAEARFEWMKTVDRPQQMLLKLAGLENG